MEFQPYDVGYPKIRIGNNSDGGYVIIDNLFDSVCMIGYGVDDNVSFDNEFTEKYKIPAYIFDHTIKTVPKTNEWVTFIPEGIGSVNEPPLFTLAHHVEKFVPEGKYYVLKMDVEGAEWNVLRTADLTRVSQLIIELHEMWKTPKDVIDKINLDFFLVHVHGNNCFNQPTFRLDRVHTCPSYLECTWVRKNLITEWKLDYSEYPTILDYPNDPARKDLSLNMWKKYDPITFVIPNVDYKNMIIPFLTDDDKISMVINEDKGENIFVLKDGDIIPHDVITSLHTVGNPGVYSFIVIHNGLQRPDNRFIYKNTSMSYTTEVPILNMKSIDLKPIRVINLE